MEIRTAYDPGGGRRECYDQRKGSNSLALVDNDGREFANLAAASSAPVLLQGETGSGKTCLARLIHSLSPRSARPFLPVNCAAVPEALFESEMFGHVRGAFTGAVDSRPGFFESASGGTLLLDEIGEIPLHVQAKLLRVLEQGAVRRVGAATFTQVDIRIIAATNHNLWDAAQRGRFRDDLYFRCAVLEYRLRPLRQRRPDIPDIARYLLARSADSVDGTPEISADALDLLTSYGWPGNIRELDNVLRRARVYASSGFIQPQHLPESVRKQRAFNGSARSVADSSQRYSAPESPEQERTRILEALQTESGNKTRAAKRLGMARSTLWVKLKEHGS